VTIDHPGGSPLLAANSLGFFPGVSAAVKYLHENDLYEDAIAWAKWETGTIFSFVHKYRQGRVYYQADFERIEILSQIDVDPDTLNLRSEGQWVTAYIELPEGCDVADINVSTIVLNGNVLAESRAVAIGDYDNDSVSDLMANFSRTEVTECILSKHIITGNVTLTVTGRLNNGSWFGGGDTIKVRMPGDINIDGKVDIKDIVLAAKSFGSYPEHPRWNPLADENEDDKIDIRDLFSVARNFGETYT
jgi:hypothetical protein